MSPDMEQDLHRTHSEWSSENGLRRDETRQWQYELYKLKADLPRLHAALECHETALADHAAAIREYDAALKAEEHILAESHGKAYCEDLPALAEHVGREEAAHLQIADLHELVKEHHFEVLKHWHELIHALMKCDRPPQG